MYLLRPTALGRAILLRRPLRRTGGVHIVPRATDNSFMENSH